MPGNAVELLHSAGEMNQCLVPLGDDSNRLLTDLVFLPVVLYGWKGTSGRYQCFALRPFINVLGIRLVKSGGVAQGEDDGSFDML